MEQEKVRVWNKEEGGMNVELLKRVATKLRRMRHKKHFYMPDFFKKDECGTAACIAGHGLILQGYKVKFDQYGDYKLFKPNGQLVPDLPGSPFVPAFIAGQREFGLTAGQAERLFNSSYWPEGFDYTDPKSAAARIDHFIATKGKVRCNSVEIELQSNGLFRCYHCGKTATAAIEIKLLPPLEPPPPGWWEALSVVRV